jgi:cobalt-precorrin-5B (C1)-methyltransferase
MVKLAQGALDLHSGRSQVDLDLLADLVPELPRQLVLGANTAQQVLDMAPGTDLADRIAGRALATARSVLRDAPVSLDTVIVSREGKFIGHAA